MDYTLGKEQIDIQRAAREFAKGEFDPDLVLEYDSRQEFPSGVWKKACRLGFTGVHYPEAYGGQGLGILDNALIAEAFCRQDSGIGSAMALSDFGAEILIHHGSDEQKKMVLPLVAQGEALMTLAFTEEGYALGPFSTTSVKEGGSHLINGKKSLILMGDTAGYMIVFCQDGCEQDSGQTGFLVTRGAEGLEYTARREKMGMRTLPVCDVLFRDVRAGSQDILGSEGKGTPCLESFLDSARIECAAMAVGIAQGALDRAIEYAKKREQFNRPIATFETIRNRLADMYTLVETARLVLYQAAWSYDQAKPDHKAILVSRMVAGHAALRVADNALQIHGGYGYMTEGHVEHFYRDAKALDVFLEPAYRQRSLLADEIAGRVR